jgi:hypothetical protein
VDLQALFPERADDRVQELFIYHKYRQVENGHYPVRFCGTGWLHSVGCLAEKASAG